MKIAHHTMRTMTIMDSCFFSDTCKAIRKKLPNKQGTTNIYGYVKNYLCQRLFSDNIVVLKCIKCCEGLKICFNLFLDHVSGDVKYIMSYITKMIK